MAKTPTPASRREEPLSRERVVDAAIELLDAGGEAGLTFRALSERLATGPGALYGHVADKNDLLTAACDRIVARALALPAAEDTPSATLRAVALGLFEAIDAHPWVGSALTRSPGPMPMLRILERVGQQVQALGVAPPAQWAAVSTLLGFIVGVSGQNAANAQVAQARGLDRDDFLGGLATRWSQLDPQQYPFARRIAADFRAHDDRADYLAGIDLILAGLISTGRVRPADAS
jgi:AcrR family transcriptional regulator